MWSKRCKTSTFIAKLFLKQHFRSETVFKAKLLKRDFFLAKLPKRNAFLAKRSETYEAKQSETKRNFIFVVSRNWSETKRNCFCFAKFRFEAKFFLKRNWDTLSCTRPGCFYFMYNIWQDAGIRTRVAATAARCATNELHTSLWATHIPMSYTHP